VLRTNRTLRLNRFPPEHFTIGISRYTATNLAVFYNPSCEIMALTIGTQVGSHEITALLGKGGMGEVYRARDTKLEIAEVVLADAELKYFIDDGQ